MSPTHRSWIIDLTLLVSILALFYGFCLGSYPLFTPDEGRYAEAAREMLVTGDYITPRVNGVAFLDKPILYYWLQAAAMKLFGVNEWAIRFFPALLGVFGCLMVYVCGRKIFNRYTGIAGCLMLAISPLYFASAHYANLDLEVAVFISCTLLCFMTALRSPNRPDVPWLYATYIFAALSFLTKGMIGFVFPVLIVGSWITLTWRWNILKKTHLVAGMLLAFVLVLPWYTLVQRDNPEFLHYFFVTQQITRFLSAAVFNNNAPFWFYVPVVLLGFFPWTLFLFQAIYKFVKQILSDSLQYQNELFLLLWAAIIFIFFSIPHAKTVGYILPVFPPLALLTSHYLVSNFGYLNKHHMQVLTIIFALASTAIAAVLFELQHFGWLNIDHHVSPYMTAIAGIFLISAAISFLFIKKSFTALISIFSISTATALMILMLGAAYLNTGTAKPLAKQLQALAKPDDEIVNYFKYYYDTPLYLQQRVSVVADWQSPDIEKKDNWRREFWYGMPFQKTNGWMLTEKVFWGKWQSQKRLFVFVNKNYFKRFVANTKQYYLLGKHNDIMLVSNRPV